MLTTYANNLPNKQENPDRFVNIQFNIVQSTYPDAKQHCAAVEGAMVSDVIHSCLSIHLLNAQTEIN